MDARTSKRQKKISSKQEKRLAQDLGGRVQPASGAMSHAKGDVRKMGDVRAEAKYTSKDNYILQKPDLDKIVQEAGLESAVLQLSFLDRANRPMLEVAIFPYKGDVLRNADIQSFSKSVRLHRDRLSLKLIRADFMVAFSESDGSDPVFFRILEWSRYLEMRESQDA